MQALWVQTLYMFVTILAMINPVEAAAAFATLTADRSEASQAKIALRSSIVGLAILLGFSFVGEWLLRMLGVSLPAFEVAGGLLLLRVAFNMVFAEKTDTETANKAKESAPVGGDPSVFPLAIPIITGPGALTATVTLLGRSTDQWTTYAILIVTSIVVFAITYASMRGAQWLTKILGETGVDATGRLVGIVVAAIAVQLMINGIAGFTHGVIVR